MDPIELPFVKMSTDAVTPTRATEGSVWLDFYSPANYIIPPHLAWPYYINYMWEQEL